MIERKLLNVHIGGGLGETLLGRRGERIVVMTRESTVGPWTEVELARPPRLDGVGWELHLRLDSKAGAVHRVPVLSIDAEDVAAVLAPPTAAPPAQSEPAPREATTQPDLPVVGPATTAQAPPKTPPKARPKAPPKGLTLAELEARATQALSSGRYDLAAQSFRSLARASTPQASSWLALARASQQLLDGDAEAAFFTLEHEVDQTVTPAWVLGQLTGVSLVKTGKTLLAAAAFATASAAAVAGDDSLQQRAAAILEAEGMDQRTLEQAILDAAVTHYAARLALNPRDKAARAVFGRLRKLHQYADQVLERAFEAAAPVREAIDTVTEVVEVPDEVVDGSMASLVRGLLKGAVYVFLLWLGIRACAG